MERKVRLICVILTAVMLLALLPGCAGTKSAKEDSDAITVYMWSAGMYDSYAPYIQSRLPDVDIQFVVGNNDLDYYKFLDEHGSLPTPEDIT